MDYYNRAHWKHRAPGVEPGGDTPYISLPPWKCTRWRSAYP